MQRKAFTGFTFAEFHSLPVNFSFASFRELTPLDDANVWEFLLERNSGIIGVKRKHTALDNLEKIFLATFRLANTIGFRAMTLRDLCRETGLSMGGLYGYIQSKDQIAAMIEDVIRHIGQLSHKWFSHIKDPLDQVESMLRGIIYFSELLQPWFYFVFLESRALAQDQKDIAKEAELNMQSHLGALLNATGALPQADAHLLAAHCMALVHDWHLKRWKFRAANITPDAFADSVVGLVRARVLQVQQLA
ncbi:MAG TPA: helix-turn-helix domain-containing protein [Noviherbaspirillum sp.]|nr:helix-turn-helix domain-containing protein [Noviherbaspirillum sp.]